MVCSERELAAVKVTDADIALLVQVSSLNYPSFARGLTAIVTMFVVCFHRNWK